MSKGYVGVDSSLPKTDYDGLIELTAALNARYSDREEIQTIAQKTLRELTPNLSCNGCILGSGITEYGLAWHGSILLWCQPISRSRSLKLFRPCQVNASVYQS